jgi:hypothetical protein
MNLKIARTSESRTSVNRANLENIDWTFSNPKSLWLFFILREPFHSPVHENLSDKTGRDLNPGKEELL